MSKAKTILRKIKHRLIPQQLPLHKISGVGILYLCTGKYEVFFDEFYKSFEEKFLPGAQKFFFVFTDSERLKTKYGSHHDISFFKIEHKGWPLGTLLRNRHFYENFEAFTGLDYLFFCNANLVCKENVYLNELGLLHGNRLCGVQHPFYFHKPPQEFIVEKTVPCHAYFSEEEIPHLNHYFQGCFYGGKFDAFREMVSTIYQWTEEDLAKNIMPVWLDESYLNRYFFLYAPYPLHSGFAYPEAAEMPFRKMIVQLDKTARDNAFKRP
jgi:hypothetical protein